MNANLLAFAPQKITNALNLSFMHAKQIIIISFIDFTTNDIIWNNSFVKFTITLFMANLA